MRAPGPPAPRGARPLRASVLAATAIVMATAAAVSATSCAPAQPTVQMGPEAEVTYDGLHRVNNAGASAVWMKPDLDLRAYTKLMVVGAGMSFKTEDENGQRWWPGKSGETDFPISEEGRKRLQQEMRTAFEEELSKLQRYQLVSQPGPGVLMLAGALIDVVSKVPPVDQCTGRCDVYLTDVGEATLVLELRDSVTNEVLVRAVDRRAAGVSGWPVEANSVTVWSEVRRLAHSWARLVRQRLEGFDSVDAALAG